MYFQSKFLQLFFLSAVLCIGSCSDDEERLVTKLFKGYNKLIRPVHNMTEKVHVAFGLAFIQLINVNEKEQIMKSNVWLRLEWFDYQLKWNETDYGDIRVLRLPPDKVWKPDIVLFNNADGNYEVRYKSNVLIYPSGAVLWVPPAIYQSSCTIDVTYFPFDEQTCIMKFSSWTFSGDQVSLSLYNNKYFVDLSDYGISGTWDIVSAPAFLNNYPGNPSETDITFHIVIRRKTLFYIVNFILPTVLISLLCVLEFYLPAEAREKITLGISILLSLVVFLLLVSKILPPTSLVVPLIAKYLLFTFIMNVFSILSAVVIINWNFRGPQTHRMPNILRTIFIKFLPKLLFIRRPKKTRIRWMAEAPKAKTASTRPQRRYNGFCPVHNPRRELLEMVEFYKRNCHHDPRAHYDHNLPSTSGTSRPIKTIAGSNNTDPNFLRSEVLKVAKAIEFIAAHLRNRDAFLQAQDDWKFMAMVINRFQLYLFFIVTIIGTVTLLMHAPHLFEHVDQEKIKQIYYGK